VALIDFEAAEIHAKIVYFGPELSGKTTTLRAIAAGVPPQTCGNFRAIASESARTIFSDSLIIDFGFRLGFRLHWHLYSVPGQPRSAGPRAAVLHGADGVVFVADGTPLRMVENLDSFNELRQLLADQSKNLVNFPIVLECNKSDLPGALPASEIATVLNVPQGSGITSSAINGEGVFEALREVSKQVVARL
jgi:signal recognition particle receptor subunit beta